MELLSWFLSCVKIGAGECELCASDCLRLGFIAVHTVDFILNIGNFTQSTVGMCLGHRFLKVRLVCCLNEVTEVIILVSLVSEATANSLV